MIRTNDSSSPSSSSFDDGSNPKASVEYLPARMLNEFVYCPRLFFLEHVDGLFAHNADTIDGSIKHQRVDQRTQELPKVSSGKTTKTRGRKKKKGDDDSDRDDATHDDSIQPIHARSVTLASDEFGIIAKLDLVEADGLDATPVDYKRGRPKLGDDNTPEAWDPERVQLCVQALVLRENGYRCQHGVIYYAETRQRVAVEMDESLLQQTLAAIDGAREVMARGTIPDPLSDSPKCPRCSLVGICLPDETNALISGRTGTERQRLLFDIGPQLYQVGYTDRPTTDTVRRLISARDEQRPLYVNTPGLTVGKSDQVLQIKERGKTIQKVRMREINQVNLLGPVQITTQAVQELLQAEIPVCYFSMGNWFYGMTQGVGLKNIFTRREQFRAADHPEFCLRFAKSLVIGKLKNCRVMLMRNHRQVPKLSLRFLKAMQWEAKKCGSLDSLLGIEGAAAATYFSEFGGMIKVNRDVDSFYDDPAPSTNADDFELPAGSERDSDDGTERTVAGRGEMCFDFKSRNRRPPRDPVNALLSLAYATLAKDLTITAAAVGLDPYLGFYHQPRYGRPALALDLMEPFRPLIAESAVLSAINGRMVAIEDFIQAGDAVALTPAGRKRFFAAYESRMDSLITHPLFGYRVSYRRLLEIQTRLLARMLRGEIMEYPVFVTR